MTNRRIIDTEEFYHMGLDSYRPKKGWGYSVVVWGNMIEVCPLYDGNIVEGMDVIMCRDFVEVGKAIELIRAGKAPRYDDGGEEE
tara:strand:- start:70 stop:324 length:255 start_codon:yes stop_codon:yes gene_type:complete